MSDQLYMPISEPLSITPVSTPFASCFASSLGTRASGTWPTANKAMYIPFCFFHRQTFSGVSILNGAAVSGNVDVGIYSEDGRKLGSSGSVGQTGTNVNQNHNLTANLTLPPGNYYLAVAMDNTTGAFIKFAPGGSRLRMLGMLSQTSAFPLPSLATFAAYVAGDNFLPVTRLLKVLASPVDSAFNVFEHNLGFPVPPTIHTYSWETIGGSIIAREGLHIYNAAAAAWPVANNACWMPLFLGRRTRFQRAFVIVNTGAVNGNLDIGVYDVNWNKLFTTGSVAQSNADALQQINIDWTFGPGHFQLALAASSATGEYFRATVPTDQDHGFTAGDLRFGSSQFPLPTTLSATDARNFAPLFGLAKGTVV